MKIQYLGHSFFKVDFSNANILIDPFISSSDPSFDRLVKCPVKKQDLKDIAMILVTHEHFDHFDKDAVEHIASRNNALVVSHESILQELNLQRNLLRPITSGKSITTRGLKITALPAHHPNAFYPLAYLVEGANEKLFHAGDTALHDVFADVDADVALLPIGGTHTMDIVDAVRATKTMKPKVVIPMHYNTFEVIKADPNEFKQRIEKSILKTKPIILSPGETLEL